MTYPQAHQPDGPKWGRLLTAKETAAYLRCSVSVVYDLAHKGRLKAISLTGNTDPHKRGKKGLRILSSSVDDLVTTALAEQPAPPPKAERESVIMPSREPAQRTPVQPRSSRSRVMLPRPA